MRSVTVTALLVSFLGPASGPLAATLENTLPNSARHAALAGAAVSSVSGADSILLNPAGLGSGEGWGWAVNASPTWIERRAPVAGPKQTITSSANLAPIADLLASYHPRPSLGIGVGIAAAGGLGADYGSVRFGDYPINPEIQTLLGTFEAVVGAGYAITPEWSVGAAYRITFFLPGRSRSAQVLADGSLQVLEIEDLTGSQFTGFRLGARYRERTGAWGAGVSVRNSVEWAMTGQGSALIASPSVLSPRLPLGDVTLKVVLPLKLSLGADARIAPRTRAFLQYDFFRYSVNRTREVRIGGATLAVPTDWRDEHAVHLAIEYGEGRDWPLRLGYTFETQVVPPERPDINTVGPGVTQGLSVGSEKRVGPNLFLSGALVYQFNSGDATPAADSGAFRGDYGTQTFTIALSLSFGR